ncbi:hypothetical protein [Mycolicibacterium llatzerense]|uniref:hypothetical protein n=1 Tax=Mycolicibacterium llatzerense TaxID=280871 RepID=UPI0008DCF530|nr:hypothetical protein [Mycolicibacterium llatzerense]
MVVTACEASGEIPDPRIVEVANSNVRRSSLKPLAPEVRRAAARMVIAANEANGETPDPRIVDIANGKA